MSGSVFFKDDKMLIYKGLSGIITILNNGANNELLIKDKKFNAVSIIVFTLMGCLFAANQSLVQNISLHLDASGPQMGFMYSALYGGSMAAVLFAGELASRAGKRKAAFLTAVLVSLGSAIILSSQTIPLVTLGFFIYGTGIGGYESIAMSLVADNNGQNANRFLNFLQALFSAGAVLTPLLLAALLKQDQYRPLYVIAAAVYAGSALFYLTNKRMDTVAVQAEPQNGLAFLRFLKDGRMVLYMTGMFLHVGSETALTYWIGTYYDYVGISGYTALSYSVYWLSSIVGRLIGSRCKSASSIMAPCFLLVAAGCALLVLLPGIWLKLMSVVLVGIGFAPVYAGLALIGGQLFPENSAPAFSLMIFSAGLGGGLFQPMIGMFVTSGDPRGAYWIIAALCVVMAAVMAVLHRKRRMQEAYALHSDSTHDRVGHI